VEEGREQGTPAEARGSISFLRIVRWPKTIPLEMFPGGGPDLFEMDKVLCPLSNKTGAEPSLPRPYSGLGGGSPSSVREAEIRK
jgi:hypothetical protein